LRARNDRVSATPIVAEFDERGRVRQSGRRSLARENARLMNALIYFVKKGRL